MKYLFIETLTASMLLLFAVACTQADPSPVQGPREITVTASFEDFPKTKTHFQDGTAVLLNVDWSAGDKINLWYDGQSADGPFVTNESSHNANFRGTISFATGVTESETSGFFYTFYPYSAGNVATADGHISSNLPGVQVAVTGNNVHDGLLLAAGRSRGLAISFHYVCSIYRFRMSMEGVSVVSFEAFNNSSVAQDVAGDFSFTFDESNLATDYEVSSGQKMVTILAPDGGTFVPNTWYYLTLLPGDYASVLVKAYTGDQVGSRPDTPDASWAFTRGKFAAHSNLTNGSMTFETIVDAFPTTSLESVTWE